MHAPSVEVRSSTRRRNLLEGRRTKGLRPLESIQTPTSSNRKEVSVRCRSRPSHSLQLKGHLRNHAILKMSSRSTITNTNSVEKLSPRPLKTANAENGGTLGGGKTILSLRAPAKELTSPPLVARIRTGEVLRFPRDCTSLRNNGRRLQQSVLPHDLDSSKHVFEIMRDEESWSVLHT